MPIDTHSGYYPLMKFPMYAKVTKPEMNDYEVGNEYEMRIEDPERTEEKRESGPYNWVHDALLIAKENRRWGDVSDIEIALFGHSRDREEAVRRICVGDEEYEDDEGVVILVFIRVDKAKEIVMEDVEPVLNSFEKTDVEE
jgi:hypothetical protein